MRQTAARPVCAMFIAIVFQVGSVHSLPRRADGSGVTSMVIRSSGDLAVEDPHESLPVSSSSSLMHQTHKSANLTMPLVGFGSCGKCNGPGLDRAFAAFLDAGGRMFDTATMYGNHAQLGSLVTSSGIPRKELFIIDKIAPHTIRESKDVMQQIDKALAMLQTKYVDLMLIHGSWGPLGSTQQGRDILWQELILARKLGKVKNIGVSNFNRTMIEALYHSSGEWPAANEFEYHPWVRPHVKEMAQWCRKTGIQVIAYGSLGTGGFSGTYPAAVQVAADSHGSSPSDVLLHWALDQGAAVIPSSGNPEHIRGNLLLGSPSDSHLSLQERAAIEAEPRPKGWRRCTLVAGCFQVDNDDAHHEVHEVQPSWHESAGLLRSQIVNFFSESWQSLKAALHHQQPTCLPRTSDFTADSMDKLVQTVENRPELKPLIKRTTSSRGMGVIVLDAFLSRAETEAARSEVKKVKLNSYDGAHEYGPNHAYANAALEGQFDCTHANTPDAIRNICRKVVSTLGTHSQYLEPVVIARVYHANGTVHKHIDQVAPHEFKYCGRRTFTFLVHLEDAEGGATTFYSSHGWHWGRQKGVNMGKYSVGVKAGRAVIFPVVDATKAEDIDPNTATYETSPLHEGEPVTSGEKIILTFWFRQFQSAKAKARGCCEATSPFKSLLAEVEACAC